ncbi:glutathione S-transferase U8-like [Pistacia vera]|uniref:glutathione S-transferase U8-like n=1 Tax=Pistacia vera TaxID=55513 RepID=UPI001262B2CB|nr:glutathione S-transferase U8-like [Pistacia vera]
MEEVKVIGASLSLFCVLNELALKLKGVAYEYIEEDLRKKSNLLLQCNPVHKNVPVLLLNGKSISESLIILEYTEETWKYIRLLPADPIDRAMVRFWAKFVDDECLMGAFGACWKKGEEKDKAVESAIESFAFLEKQIEGKKYFGGEEIGYLDVALGWIPHWLTVMEQVGEMKLVDGEKLPLLNEWCHNFIQIPLIKESLPPREKLVTYFNASVGYMRSLAPNNQ